MNYNPNAGLRTPSGPVRKPKHVSDPSVMGQSMPVPENITPYMSTNPMSQSSYNPIMATTTATYPTTPTTTNMGENFYNGGVMMSNQNYNAYGVPTTMPYTGTPIQTSQQQQYATNVIGNQSMQYGIAQGVGDGRGGGGGGVGVGISQFPMFQQPIVQDMAMQYGQHLAEQSKQIMENQFSKWVPVSKLKYYFAVDNNYVIHKLCLLFFPFTHKEWALKYDQESPVQPRYDINAPDLYIPTMAFITYVVVAGLMLGLQRRFSPEKLSIQASSALAYCIFELVVYSITLYVVNIKTSLKTLDLLAFSGYKFVTIVACLLFSTLFHGLGYYMTLCYCSLSLGLFLLRTLKTKVLREAVASASPGGLNYDPYNNNPAQHFDYEGGRKRKLYFLFLVVGGQALLSFLLSKHLYFRDVNILDLKQSQF